MLSQLAVSESSRQMELIVGDVLEPETEMTEDMSDSDEANRSLEFLPGTARWVCRGMSGAWQENGRRQDGPAVGAIDYGES